MVNFINRKSYAAMLWDLGYQDLKILNRVKIQLMQQIFLKETKLIKTLY